jgi:S1-C subfamily serine protease
MQKIIIKHLKGSKANQTEMFELPFTELILGRDSSANIKFDPEKDDLVGRSHAKIIHESGQFKLADLNSRNGTFVNGKRIQDPVVLNVGDLVKLGEAGVEFSFDMDPRPENTAKATRFEQNMAVQTREQPKPTRATAQESPAVKPSIGRATVERLITETTSQTRKKMINIASGIIAVVVLGAGFLLYQSNKGQEILASALGQQKAESERTIGELEKKLPTGLSATEITAQYSGSTVFIEASWKLFQTTTGEQLFQMNACIGQNKKTHKLEYVECGKNEKPYPVYIRFGNTVEPLLTTKENKRNVYYEPIGSTDRGVWGSGFVVTENGFILTNRHVAAGWDARYTPGLPGVYVTCCNENSLSDIRWLEDNETNDFLVASLKKWIPSNTTILGGKTTTGKLVEGRNDFLDVSFPNARIRIPAHLVRNSDIADVALIKIDIPNQVNPVILANNEPVQAGEPITITGYPENSPEIDVKVQSQDPMNRSGDWRVLPFPTTSTGTIARVISSDAKTLGGTSSEYYSVMGDVYQLNVNTVGEGNSGGPVFDNEGHVVGLFTYATNKGGARNSFAVPIKYGQELMGVKPNN